MGYVREPDPPGARQTIDRWSRTWADTSNALTVEFTYSAEGGQAPGGNTLLHYVLRINVSGQTFVEAAGKRRHVRDSASLTHDVNYLAAQLRGLFR